MKPDYDTLTSQYTLLPVRESKSVWVKDLGQKIALYKRNFLTRKQLGRLTIEQLNDIGLTLEQAQNEIKKSFWKS